MPNEASLNVKVICFSRSLGESEVTDLQLRMSFKETPAGISLGSSWVEQ